MHFTELGKPLLQNSWLSIGSSLPTNNLSDMLSKHWDHPSVYPIILKLLITRGNITLTPKAATPEKERENLKLEPEKN